MYHCLDPDCGKTFPIVARVSEETRESDFRSPTSTRKVMDKPCCPFCGSIKFEEIQSGPGVEWVPFSDLKFNDLVARKKQPPKENAET